MYTIYNSLLNTKSKKQHITKSPIIQSSTKLPNEQVRYSRLYVEDIVELQRAEDTVEL